MYATKCAKIALPVLCIKKKLSTFYSSKEIVAHRTIGGLIPPALLVAQNYRDIGCKEDPVDNICSL